MAVANSYSRVKGANVGFFTFALSSSGRVQGPSVQLFGKTFSSYGRVPAVAGVFSEDYVAVRMSAFPQRAGTNIGDLVGEILDSTSGFAFTLLNAKWSTSATGPFRSLNILTGDGAYVFPGTGSPSGTAFNIPVEFGLDTAGPVYIRLTISWNAPATFSGHPTLGVGCVDYWKLDDDAADSNVLDSAPGSVTGTLQLVGGGAPQNTNNHSVAGKIATALDMRAPSNVEIDVTAVEGSPGDIFDLNKPFSIAFWTRADILSTCINVGNSVSAGFWVLQTASGGKYRLNFHFGNLTDYWQLRTLYNLVVGQWYHVVLTYDGSNSLGGMNIYVDSLDAQDSNVTIGSGATSIAGTGLIITPQNPNGPTDEVGLWTRGLNSSEIYALFTGLLTY